MKGKIFNAQEVQAILNGSKVMFREVMKPQIPDNPTSLSEKCWGNCFFGTKKAGFYYCSVKCPYQVGQKIFCKETVLEGKDGELQFFDSNLHGYCSSYWKRKPAQHMKQERSRLSLLIKDIRVERLGEISEEDVIAEGINKLYSEEQFKQVLKDHPKSTNPWKNYLWYGLIGREITRKQSDSWKNQYSNAESAKDSFASLWNATHKKPEEKFEANPWVWVVQFEK